MQQELRANLKAYPDLLHAGYTQDALKEFVEASIVCAILAGEPLPTPEDIGIDNAAYLCGLGEAAGELRRRVLDILRHGQTAEAERLMTVMDDIYGLLVTMDFPDAITGSLRRITDMVRGVVERTRGDLTTTSQQNDLKRRCGCGGQARPAVSAAASGSAPPASRRVIIPAHGSSPFPSPPGTLVANPKLAEPAPP